MRRWHTRWSIAAVGLAVLLLSAASRLWAGSASSRGIITNRLDFSPEPRDPRRSPFADKATGDWWGRRQWLQQMGITIAASIVLEGFNNFRGGLRTSPVVGASTFDLSLTADSEKLLNWPGGKFRSYWISVFSLFP